METIASPLYEQVYAVSADKLNQATGLWFTYLGLVGLIVYAGMAVKRPKWAPSDFNLCIFSCTACAVGGLILAHPGSPSLDKGSLNFGAVLIWSVGAPISDVVAVRESWCASLSLWANRSPVSLVAPYVLQVSCFSLVVSFSACALHHMSSLTCRHSFVQVQGQEQGKWMASITMAGSIGRIIFPLLLLALADTDTLYVACALSAVCVPMLLAYAWMKRRSSAADTTGVMPTPGKTIARELSMALFGGRPLLGGSQDATNERAPLLAGNVDGSSQAPLTVTVDQQRVASAGSL